MAFLKFIYHNNCALAPDWANDPVRRYRSATIAEKNRFCLEQSIIISYLDYIYGSGMELFQQYRKFFTSWYLAELRDLASTATDPFTKANYINCAILLRLMPGKIDSTHAIRLLSDETVEVPCAVVKSFYEPYLKFKENVSDLRQYVENDQLNRSRSFTISHACTIPAFKVDGRYIVASYGMELSSYNFSYNDLKDVIEEMKEVDTIYTFLAGYKWSGRNSTGVLGVLSSQCLTHDFFDTDPDSAMFGFLDVYSKVVDTSISPKFLSPALTAALTTQRRKIVQFIVYLRKHHRIVVEDAKILADYAATIDVDDNHPLKQYFLTDDPREISSEAYSAFRRSRFADFEELDKFARGYRNAAAGGERSGTDDKNGSDGAEAPDQKGSAPKPENQNTEDELNRLESPTGIQDSSKDDKKSNDADSDTTPNAEQNSDPNQTPEETSDDEELPPLPRVSDKKGVKLKLSEGESPDTVFYREELREYIDTLLKNPPSNFSVQTIAAIKRVRANWLYLLDVKCLYDFLSAIIKMPKTLKVKPPKKED